MALLAPAAACTRTSGAPDAGAALIALSYDGTDGFTEIIDGGTVRLDIGPTGGVALRVAPRLFGFGSGTVQAQATLFDPITGLEVASDNHPSLEVKNTGDGFADPADAYADALFLWVCVLSPAQTSISGQPYDLTLSVMQGGAVLTTRLSVTPTCRELAAECECACLGRGCT